MEWPVACVVIAAILSATSLVRARIYVRSDEVAEELDEVWNAIDITTRDVERLTPLGFSLEDQ